MRTPRVPPEIRSAIERWFEKKQEIGKVKDCAKRLNVPPAMVSSVLCQIRRAR